MKLVFLMYLEEDDDLVSMRRLGLEECLLKIT